MKIRSYTALYASFGILFSTDTVLSQYEPYEIVSAFEPYIILYWFRRQIRFSWRVRPYSRMGKWYARQRDQGQPF
jgi:hypothetical protein